MEPTKNEADRKIKELAENNSDTWDALIAWIREVTLLRRRTETEEGYNELIEKRNDALDTLEEFLFNESSQR